MGGLRRVQRRLKSANIVQHRLILGDGNVLRLLTRRDSTLLDGSRVGATLRGQLHELLEGLRKGPDVGQLATRCSLTRRVVLDTRRLAILRLHDRLWVDRRSHLLTRRRIDAIHAQDTKAIRAILLDRSLQSGLRDRRRTRNDLTLVRELGLIGNTQLIRGTRQRLLLHLVELLVATRRQVRVTVVQARSDMRLLDREDIRHTHGRVHARLQELRLILCTKGLSHARLGILEGLLLTLVVECGLSTTGVLIQDSLVGARLRGLGDTGSKKGNHVGVSLRRSLVLDIVICLRLGSRRNEGFARVLHGFRKSRIACKDISQGSETEKQSQLCHLCSPRQDSFLQFRESLQRGCLSSHPAARWESRGKLVRKDPPVRSVRDPPVPREPQPIQAQPVLRDERVPQVPREMQVQ